MTSGCAAALGILLTCETIAHRDLRNGVLAKMSGWTPPTDDSRGTASEPGYRTSDPNYGTREPDYGPAEPGYGAPHGHQEPDPDDRYPPRQPHLLRQRLAITAGIVIAVVIIAGVFVFVLNKKTKWTLTAPQTVAGLSRDTSPAAQSTLGAQVTKFRSDVTSLPNFGTLTSTVSGVYTLGNGKILGFIGFNGSFNVQVALTNGPGLKVSNVNPGSHGGTAACGTGGTEVICQWSTNSTVGIMVILPGSQQSVTESAKSASSLMLRLRDQVESHAGR
ncbi:MAG TPA: hypothetical protein VGI31_00555 [Streptosporangiaceae bacterium]